MAANSTKKLLFWLPERAATMLHFSRRNGGGVEPAVCARAMHTTPPSVTPADGQRNLLCSETVRHHEIDGAKRIIFCLHNLRPEAVDQLLENMNEEVASAMGQSAKLIASEDLPAHLTDAQRFTVLGFQQKGLDMIRLQGQGKDLTPLLQAAHVLHRKPRTLPPNTRLTLLLGEETVKIDFEGFGTAPNGDITVNYCHAGEDIICTTPNPDAVEQQSATGNRKADPSCPTEYGTVVPGELLSYLVAPGDTLEAGKPMAVLESMKMEVKIPVPESFNGHVVKDLPCKGRTAEQQGTMLSPGDLLMETTVPKP